MQIVYIKGCISACLTHPPGICVCIFDGEETNELHIPTFCVWWMNFFKLTWWVYWIFWCIIVILTHSLYNCSSSSRHSTEVSHYPDAYLYSHVQPYNQQGHFETLIEQKRPIKKFVYFPCLLSSLFSYYNLSGCSMQFIMQAKAQFFLLFWGS